MISSFSQLQCLIIFLSFLHSNIIAAGASSSVNLHQISLVGNVDRSSLFALNDVARAYKLIDNELSIEIIQSLTTASINSVVTQTSDFAVILSGIPAVTAAAAPSLYIVPLLTTGMVPIYRLDALGVNAPPLIIPRQVLTMIYTGSIKWWNDSLLAAVNPSLTLPQQRITMIIESGVDVHINLLLKQCLSSFNNVEFANSSMTISTVNDFPLSKYSAYQTTISGMTNLVTAVVATDGSFGVAFHAIAASLGVSIASMVNQAGTTVAITPDSLTFAAVELGTKPLPKTSAAVLTDATGTSSWPMTLFSYLLVDIENSRGSCKARQDLIEFLLYFYQSAVASSILASRSYAPIPSIIMSQLGVIDVLKTQMKCRGNTALPVQVTTARTLATGSSLTFHAQLLAATYQSVDTIVEWKIQEISNPIIVTQLVNSEIDIGLVKPDMVDQELWQAVVDSDEYLIIPAYAQAVSWFANPALSSDVNIAGQPFVLDMATIIEIMSVCIKSYNDARLYKLNPWLESALKNETILIWSIMGCSGAPLADWFGLELYEYSYQYPNTEAAQCIQTNWAPDSPFLKAYLACTNVPELGLMFSKYEPATPALVLGTNGAQGVTIVTDDNDKLFPLMPVQRNGITVNTKSDLNGIMACAYDTFNTKTLSFNFDQTNNASCWPLTQQTVAVVRKQYYSDSAVTNSSSCSRGLDALEFVRWLLVTPEIDALTNAGMIGRLSNVPGGVQQAYLNALNAVTCDGETLLITLPIIWELSSGLSGFGYAAAVIGFVLTSVLMGFTIVYHKHPIIRAASPLFMSVSLFGVIMMFAGAVALVLPVSTISCGAVSWLINLGIMVTFAPLFAKTWRIYRIFGRRKLSVVKISNRKLMFIIGILLLIEAIIMIIWESISPLQAIITSTMEGSPARVHQYEQCGVHDVGTSMFAIVAVEKGILLLFGALMAFSTRRVSSQFNESSQVALAIYNVVFSIGIIAPIIFVIGATGDVLVALLLFVLLWISFFTACILVIPKVLHILSPENAGDGKQSVVGSSGNSSSGFSFVSLNIFDSLSMITNYLSSLKRHVEAVENKICQMRKSLKPHPNNSQIASNNPHQPIPSNNNSSTHINNNAANNSSVAVSSSPIVSRRSPSLGDINKNIAQIIKNGNEKMFPRASSSQIRDAALQTISDK